MGPGVLSHLDATGRAHMVNVTAKPNTGRHALARCRVVCSRDDLDPQWADVFSAARLAGMQAAKRTAELIPLCHPLLLSGIEVRVERDGREIAIEAEASLIGQTGVEMEALTACATAALTVVAALKVDDPTVAIEDLALWEKSGGRSGEWTRP
jgi:cyclic pyranopterin monophosphate synthase